MLVTLLIAVFIFGVLTGAALLACAVLWKNSNG